MKFTIYTSNTVQNAKNCIYPNRKEITSKDELLEALANDQVFAKYNSNYRSVDNFIESDVIPQDSDNPSDDESTWLDAKTLHEKFKDVQHVIVPSRHNMKEKNGKKARPKNHIFFPVPTIHDSKEYEERKKQVLDSFPFFDEGANDIARFFFASNCNPEEIIWNDVDKTILDLLQEDDDRFANLPDKKELSIKEGGRNNTMSRYASKVLIKYGDTAEAYEAFLQLSEKCEPPLDDKELSLIWSSAKKFYSTKVANNPDYIPPEKYNDNKSYKPSDFTDVGQAMVLAKYFSDELRFNEGTGFLRFTGSHWEESEIGAHAVVHDLTSKQLLEAQREIGKCIQEMTSNGAMDLVDDKGKKASETMSDAQLEVYNRYLEAVRYQKFVLGRRESKYISACLKEVKPMIHIGIHELDSDPFLICTPKATYDLRKGMEGEKPHEPLDFLTKMTAVSPSDKGKQIWLDCLNKIFAKNPELIDYVQLVCGLAAVGKVMVEGMIIAYGDGGNGKSTFWNAVFRTLGLYSGKISADTLTTTCRRNTKPEMAEAKGKRLLIASESQQGARLDESMVKQLCSTDEVQAEKKYKDPFHYVPCHTLVLYTNYLPRVSGIDDGIWSRLFVIPFYNKLRGGSGDVKNYADYLFENAGEYIMKWIIEGAKKVIDLNFHLPTPKVVQDAISEYREQNNWFNHFIEDCCEVDPASKASSNDLYSAYRKYSQDNGEFVRSTTEFYTTLEKHGYKKFIEKRIKYVKGLRLCYENGAFEDFLT